MARGHIDGIICTVEDDVNKEFCHSCHAWVSPPPVEETTHNGTFKRISAVQSVTGSCGNG